MEDYYQKCPKESKQIKLEAIKIETFKTDLILHVSNIYILSMDHPDFSTLFNDELTPIPT